MSARSAQLLTLFKGALLAVALTVAAPGVSVEAAPAAKKTTSKAAASKKAAPKKAAAKRPSTAAKKKTVASKTKKPSAVKKTASLATGIAAASLPPALSSGGTPDRLDLGSTVAFVQDLGSSDVLFAKNEAAVLPIASITKLMTALVVVDAEQDLDEQLEITRDDIDYLKNTRSRLVVGTRLTRREMLHLALMSSENRAANALGRHYPGGLAAFVQAMNAKAKLLGMFETGFVEPTGLDSSNVSSPRDLVQLMKVASSRPLIRGFTTDTEYQVLVNGKVERFRNTNYLVSKPEWNISVSKTGFIREAGRCLVMLAQIDGRELAIVLLDSTGTLTRTADAVRIRKWLESTV
ncbi:MAG: D-alanyl-D-alanine endopeptidase [Pigmentiphaga sp.]